MSQKDAKQMVARLEAAGFIVAKARRGGHYRILRPNGSFLVTMAVSPSDYRFPRQVASQVFKMTGVRI